MNRMWHLYRDFTVIISLYTRQSSIFLSKYPGTDEVQIIKPINRPNPIPSRRHPIFNAMNFIMVPAIMAIITVGIYKLFELFVCKKERLMLIEKTNPIPSRRHPIFNAEKE